MVSGVTTKTIIATLAIPHALSVVVLSLLSAPDAEILKLQTRSEQLPSLAIYSSELLARFQNAAMVNSLHGTTLQMTTKTIWDNV